MVGEQSVNMDLVGVKRMLSAGSLDGPMVLTPTAIDIRIQAYISLLICCVEEQRQILLTVLAH